MDRECHFCKLKDNCPGYYVGCYGAVNGKSLQEVGENINSVEKVIDDMGIRHLFSMSFSEFLSK